MYCKIFLKCLKKFTSLFILQETSQGTSSRVNKRLESNLFFASLFQAFIILLIIFFTFCVKSSLKNHFLKQNSKKNKIINIRFNIIIVRFQSPVLPNTDANGKSKRDLIFCCLLFEFEYLRQLLLQLEGGKIQIHILAML